MEPGNRDKNGRFAPGNKANPTGRPKLTNDQQDALAAIKQLAPEAAAVLARMLHSKQTPAAVRLKAVQEILDRTYGRPDSTVHLDAPKAAMLDDIRAELTALQKEVGQGD